MTKTFKGQRIFWRVLKRPSDCGADQADSSVPGNARPLLRIIDIIIEEKH